VDQRSAEIRQCYMLGTFRDSQLEGTVNVLFTINPNGRVSDTVDGGSDMPDPQVVACVLDVFAKMEFRAGGYYPTQVQFPISFGKS
ncbi:MAG TPA: AgmX/PglI C-terminal domain-containing protein, partial [Polyangiaceae bacterium]|nr:AgmX/PglI C-terminal domain-containing protein [Polyangiaceae bacterium]